MSFFFLYVTACFCFADAFHTASEYQRDYDLEATNKTVFYDSYRLSFINSYTYMMASKGDLDISYSYLSMIVFITASVFIYLVLMNLLIARVGNTFG